MLSRLLVTALLMCGQPIETTFARADFHYTDIKIVDGTDKISGSGHDSGIQYISPDPFTGPEYMASLNGLCFTASADRFEYSVCPFHNVTQRRVTGGRPTLLGVWGDWDSANIGANPRMLFFRGQACGQATRRATIEVIPGSPDDFRVDADSIDESPACHFNMRFHVPFPSELLTFNLISRKAVSGDRTESSSASGAVFTAATTTTTPQYVDATKSQSPGHAQTAGTPHGPSRLHGAAATASSSSVSGSASGEPTELMKTLSKALEEVRPQSWIAA